MELLTMVVSNEPVPVKTEPANGLFDRLVSAIENTYLFKEYVSTWAAPFDNASFDAVLLIIAVLALLWSLFGIIMNIIYRKKVRARQAQIEEKRMEYLRFLKENNERGISYDVQRDIKSKEEPEPLLNTKETAVEPEGEEQDPIKPLTEEALDIPVEEEIKEAVPQKEEVADREETTLKEESTITDMERILKEKQGEESEPDPDNVAFGQLIVNLKQRQKQEARAKEIENEAIETTRKNLEKLQNDMEDAIAGNKVQSGEKAAKDKDAGILTDAQKKAVREREKEQQRLQKMQNKGKRWKTPELITE